MIEGGAEKLRGEAERQSGAILSGASSSRDVTSCGLLRYLVQGPREPGAGEEGDGGGAKITARTRGRVDQNGGSSMPLFGKERCVGGLARMKRKNQDVGARHSPRPVWCEKRARARGTGAGARPPQ